MDTVVAILQVAIGLGFVIFVHELGHFAVAKWCGVRCDKFFVGFDIGGYKLSRKWGETEYGIGILPLGGYVKMFGQEDNVANVAEEIAASKSLEGSPDAKQITGPDGKPAWVHRRSYLAKSVPQRMAIISAGVIMNVIFAFVFAWFAFGIGVPERPCVVQSAVPASPAWKAGLRPGDEILRLGDVETPAYRELVESVMLGDNEDGVAMTVRRAASGAEESLTIQPDTDGPLPRIGVEPPVAVRLAAKDAVRPHSPAAAASEAGAGFEDGDQIVGAAGAAISAYYELAAVLLANKTEPLTYTVVRGGRAPISDPFGPVTGGERVEVTVGPNPMERLGVVPRLGAITAIEESSPADEAGLAVGDTIVAINGVAVGNAADGEESYDPVTLDDRLATLADGGESATLTIRRGDETLDLAATPRVATWRNRPLDPRDPIEIAALGVACPLIAEVQAVVAGSPAAEADLRAGDRLLRATVASTDASDRVAAAPLEIPLTEGQSGWSLLLAAIQDCSPELTVELLVERAGSQRAVELKPAASADFAFARGVALRPLKRLQTAYSLADQTRLAWDETTGALGAVFKFLSKIGRQVPVTALGGPITIAKGAGASAFEGFGSLLVFLTMLSANLAVLNFLPIPVLDGGHMVFLAWEGVTGRPANERVVMTLHSIGFLFLITLMGFVFALDLGWIPRGL